MLGSAWTKKKESEVMLEKGFGESGTAAMSGKHAGGSRGIWEQFKESVPWKTLCEHPQKPGSNT